MLGSLVNNHLWVIGGPTCAGKSVTAQGIEEKIDCAYRCVKETTRKPRQNEIDGRDYNFITGDDFKQRAGQGLYSFHYEKFGNLYGVPLAVEQEHAAGKEILLTVTDCSAFDELVARYEYSKSVYIYASLAVLNQRLRLRKCSEEERRVRMQSASAEIKMWQMYMKHHHIDYVINNSCPLGNRDIAGGMLTEARDTSLESRIDDMVGIIMGERYPK